MSTILETDASGGLHIPAALLPHAAPHRKYVVESELERVVVSDQQTASPFWQTSTPEVRAADILKWAASHKRGPNLPDSAVGRDAIYE